ncbi:MAG TPA: hypothetical protein PK967_16830 [Candidatus Hydrogenedentes bacterium]|nr:hypothetical protein [Candidatus Hydrogenedentota bacterium]
MVAALLVLCALGAPPAMPSTGPPPVRVDVVAIHALDEPRSGKQYEGGLESVKAALEDLPYNTYRRLDAANIQAPFNEDTIVPLTDRHRLYLRPLSKEPHDQVRLNVRLHMTRKPETGGVSVNAINTTVIAGAGRQVKLRGVKLDQGELIVVITIRK